MSDIIRQLAAALKNQEYELTERDLGEAYLEGSKNWVEWMSNVTIKRLNKRLRGPYEYKRIEDVPANEMRKLHLDFVSGQEGEVAGFMALQAFNPIRNTRQREQAYNHYDLSVALQKYDIKLMSPPIDKYKRTTVSFSNFSKLSNMYKAHEPVGLLVMERYTKYLFKPVLICTQAALHDALFVSQFYNDDYRFYMGRSMRELLRVDPEADPNVTILTEHFQSIRHLNNELFVLNDKFKRSKPKVNHD